MSYIVKVGLFPFAMVPHLQEHAFVDEQQSAECVGCTHGNFCVIFSAKAKQLLLLLFFGLVVPPGTDYQDGGTLCWMMSPDSAHSSWRVVSKCERRGRERYADHCALMQS